MVMKKQPSCYMWQQDHVDQPWEHLHVLMLSQNQGIVAIVQPAIR
jgi:hypothetical protein